MGRRMTRGEEMKRWREDEKMRRRGSKIYDARR
jgi:hypothetical protein